MLHADGGAWNAALGVASEEPKGLGVAVGEQDLRAAEAGGAEAQQPAARAEVHDTAAR